MTAVRPAGPDTAVPKVGVGRRRAITILVATAVLVLLADLGTKQWALSALTPSEPVRLFGGAVYLTLIRNSGAAFGLGSEYTWVFPLVTVAVVGWISWMATRLRSLPWAISLGLVLAGALGNFTDRIFRAPGPFLGHVVDMVSLFDPYGQTWPIFNLADSALVSGVILAILLELTGRQRDGTRVRNRSAGADDGTDRDASTETRTAPDNPDAEPGSRDRDVR
ncbi:signal peptidase II [Micromonospora sp. NBC_01796]|uniref:signal peptidase II n=1 Tax=Micromonospora sp. NBC_01796 TaxID=2975987 RepID=UPI002DD9AC15|nr:signal peptidase II [Micromonospora sp. NBC_01796]WSA83452.1 signal peptidase II [Micromonospora sp. NBC_01796]